MYTLYCQDMTSDLIYRENLHSAKNVQLAITMKNEHMAKSIVDYICITALSLEFFKHFFPVVNFFHVLKFTRARGQKRCQIKTSYICEQFKK